jgi:hypothetical protein
MPLQQPKVETMMAAAMILRGGRPEHDETTAVATRSSGAVWICGSVSTER